VKPKVMVIQDIELEKWRDYHILEMSFDEVMQLIKDLQNGLFDHKRLSRQTGLNFFIVIRK